MYTHKKHRIINLFVPVFLLLLMVACSTSRKAPAIDRYPFEIYFGSTGGFTNINPSYIVRSSGEVLRKENSSSDPNHLKHIRRQKIDSLYLLIQESNLGNLKIKQISNVTNYIEIKSEKFNNRLEWFDDSQIPFEVNKLYHSLLSVIKK
jgi:hypothetical protein